MANAIRKYEDDFSPAEPNLREGLAVVPPLREESFAPAETVDTSALAMAEKAYRALHVGFVALPIIAGVDKFANEVTNWGQYLAPSIPGLFSLTPSTFMVGVGVFEIMLGIGLALKPRLFADIFSAYLIAIIVNLLVYGAYFEVALFDFALAAGACGLARLSAARERGLFRSLPDEPTPAPRERGAA
jgi:hypothetical protein